MTQMYQFFEFKLARLQLDNQLPDAIFPVALSNTVRLDTRDFLHASCVRQYREHGYHYLPYLSILVQEMDMMLDIGFVERISSFIGAAILAGQGTASAHNSSSMVAKRLKKSDGDSALAKGSMKPFTLVGIPVPQSLHSGQQKHVYFESLVLHPIKWNLSFIFTTSRPAHDTLYSAESNNLLTAIQAIGSRLNANIDDVPLKLNALILQNPFMPGDALLTNIAEHYMKRSVQEMYKLFGSSDFIGNPIGLVKDLDTAMYDLFYEPIDAISHSPQDFVKGLARGSLSFLKHSIHGTFNTASKVSETVGHGLSYLSLDSDYVSHRQSNRIHRRPKHAGEGVLYGIQALGEGLVDGASGIVLNPLRGASSGGFLGFLSGVGKGLAGAPVKPVSGLFEAVSHAAEGIRKTVKRYNHDEKRRARPPRHIGIDGTLRPYSAELALGQMLLFEILGQERRQRMLQQQQKQTNVPSSSSVSSAPAISEFRHHRHDGLQRREIYVFHAVIGSHHTVLVSNKRLFYINTLANTTTIEWQQSLADFSTVKRIGEMTEDGAPPQSPDSINQGVVIKISAECQQRQREASWLRRVSVTERQIMSSSRKDRDSLNRLYSVLHGLINQKDQDRILDDSIR